MCSMKLSGFVSTGMGDRFGALLMSLVSLGLVLVD